MSIHNIRGGKAAAAHHDHCEMIDYYFTKSVGIQNVYDMYLTVISVFFFRQP